MVKNDIAPLQTRLVEAAAGKTDWRGTISFADAKKILDDVQSGGKTSPEDIAKAIAALGPLVSPNVARAFNEVVSFRDLPSRKEAVSFADDIGINFAVTDDYVTARKNFVGGGTAATTATEKNDNEIAIGLLDVAATRLARAKTPKDQTSAAKNLQKTIDDTKDKGAIALDGVKIGAEAWWHKALDAIAEIFTAGFANTRLVNGKTDVEVWRNYGRQTMSDNLGPALQARFKKILQEKEDDVPQAKAQLQKEIENRLADLAHVTKSVNGSSKNEYVVSLKEIHNSAAAFTDGVVEVAITGGLREVPAPQLTPKTKSASGTLEASKAFVAYHATRADLVAQLQTVNQGTNRAGHIWRMIRGLDETAKRATADFAKDPGADKTIAAALAAATTAVKADHVPATVGAQALPAAVGHPWPELKPKQIALMHRLLGPQATQADVVNVQRLVVALKLEKLLGTFGVDGVPGGNFQRALEAVLTAKKIKVPVSQRLQALAKLPAGTPATAPASQTPKAKAPAAHLAPKANALKPPSAKLYAAKLHPSKAPPARK